MHVLEDNITKEWVSVAPSWDQVNILHTKAQSQSVSKPDGSNQRA